MKLNMIAKAAKQAVAPNHSILLYGPPKTGKTRLVGTAAKIPAVQRIFWFDLENGSETLAHMDLTEEEMEKITVFRIPDTKQKPEAIITILKALTSKTPVSICDAHGKVSCAICIKANAGQEKFLLSDCNHNDLVVLDSGSQLGDSAVNAACLGKGEDFKPGWDEYGEAGRYLSDIMSVIQACANTNFVVITHELSTEDDGGKDKIVPLCGTKNFSLKVAKYFGTVIYTYKKMNKHVAGSSSLFRGDLMTGSRIGVQMEKATEPDMKQILIEGGVLKVGSPEEAPVVHDTLTEIVTTAAVVKPLTLAEKIAARKAGG